ncbi:hypothetical protein D3C76_1194340 [compost metagenome]
MCRTLHIQAVIGVEIDVPANRPCVVLGIDVGIVAALGDVGEYRLVGIGPLVAAFFCRQLPFQGLVQRQVVAGTEVETGQPAAVPVILAELVAVETVVLLA